MQIWRSLKLEPKNGIVIEKMTKQGMLRSLLRINKLFDNPFAAFCWPFSWKDAFFLKNPEIVLYSTLISYPDYCCQVFARDEQIFSYTVKRFEWMKKESRSINECRDYIWRIHGIETSLPRFCGKRNPRRTKETSWEKKNWKRITKIPNHLTFVKWLGIYL